MKFRDSMTIDTREISERHPTYVIAEAGVNHNGDMQLAERLIDLAADAGADAVKFQTFKTKHLILRDVGKAPYQESTTDKAESQYEMLERLELRLEQNRRLKAYCEHRGITFLSTPFDEPSVDELESLDVSAYKIASTDLTNIPFIRRIAGLGKPVLLSTGMAYLDEVRAAVGAVGGSNDQLVLLQCTANYPIQDNEANLRVLKTYAEEFDCLLGYSDHTVGVGAAPYAIPLGACVVEKHFTLDRGMGGPDHRASLSPDELHAFVRQVRIVESYLGSSNKEPTESEHATRASLQKCLVARQAIARGEEITEEKLSAKRTGGRGVSPLRIDEIVGTRAQRPYKADDIIEAPSP